jgi:hypothetical protein
MREDEFLNVFVTKESKLTAADINEYGGILIEEGRKERQNRENSMGSPRLRRTRKSRHGAKASNEVMVVFPFGSLGADEEEIDGAAAGLNELNSASVSRAIVPVGEGSKTALKTSDDDELTGPNSSDDAETAENDKGDSNEKSKPRAHFLTIREEDNERLQPGEFLNDTLIDFWMQWYVASPHVRLLNGCPRLIRFLCCSSSLGSGAKRSIWRTVPFISSPRISTVFSMRMVPRPSLHGLLGRTLTSLGKSLSLFLSTKAYTGPSAVWSIRAPF